MQIERCTAANCDHVHADANIHVYASPHQQEPQPPWSLMGVVSIPLQSAEVASPWNASTSTTLVRSLSNPRGSTLPKYSVLNSWGERSDSALMPNTAVPFPAFAAALSLSTSFRDSLNSLNLVFLSFAVAYFERGVERSVRTSSCCHKFALLVPFVTLREYVIS